MDCREFRFSRHAIERMFERGIAPATVQRIVRDGEIIASYPEDTPYPSALVLGYDSGKPIHAIVARDAPTGICYIVTAYRPDPNLWCDDFKTRREP